MKGKIYKLISKLTSNIYVGSTIQTLDRRFLDHKSDYRRFINKKEHYMTSFELLQHEDVKIELIENYPCTSKKELETKEREWIRENKNKYVNKFVPGRTRKEHYEDNKDEIKEKRVKYYEENKEKVKKQLEKYYEEHKDKINEQKAKYNEDNKDKIKKYKAKYYEEHKDKIKEKQVKYDEEHKGKIKERQSKPFQCECGSTLTTNSRARHLKTQRHKKYIFT